MPSRAALCRLNDVSMDFDFKRFTPTSPIKGGSVHPLRKRPGQLTLRLDPLDPIVAMHLLNDLHGDERLVVLVVAIALMARECRSYRVKRRPSTFVGTAHG